MELDKYAIIIKRILGLIVQPIKIIALVIKKDAINQA